MATRKRSQRRHRQADLLSRIPREALLGALAHYPSVRDVAWAHRPDLNRIVRQTLTPAELEKLQKDWRYGKRVSTALLLCSDEPEVTPRILGEALQGALDAAAPPDESQIEQKMRVTVREVTPFDGSQFLEVTFRYGHAFSFINLEEEEVTEHESRYGFIWIVPSEAFVAIGADESVIAEIRPVLERVLGVALLRSSLGKRTVEQVFPIDTAASLAHYDPVTEWRIRYSGARLADSPTEFAELRARDDERDRISALYQQRIASQAVNVGVTSPTARITTTRPVAADALRAWEVPKLTGLARALHQLRKDRPAEFYGKVDLALAEVPAKYRAVVQILVTAVAEARALKRDSVPLPASADAGVLASALPAHAGYLVSRPFCEQCGDTALAQCGRCASTTLSKGLVGCGACGAKTFVCEQGHDIPPGAWKDGLTFHPGSRLLGWIAAGLDELRQRPGLNIASESVRIRGRELLYAMRKTLPDAEYNVLQADVKHSTVLRTKQPERYRELQARVRDSLDRTARRRRGDMASWGGDGGFWLFRSPEDAMLAALELQRELGEHGFAPDTVRVAIAMGPVAIEHGEYDGDVLHLAARMQKHATTGTRIVVDAPTAKALGHHLDLGEGRPVSELDPAYKARRDQFFRVRAVRDSLFARAGASGSSASAARP